MTLFNAVFRWFFFLLATQQELLDKGSRPSP